MVKIQKQVTSIPVDFGEFELYFYKSDENIQRLTALQAEFEQVFKSFDKDGEKTFEDLEVIKNQLKVAFDSSTLHALIYFLQAMEGIMKEFNLEEETKAINKYLKV